jgi:enoyl-CoA hydratase/carnithine racemase
LVWFFRGVLGIFTDMTALYKKFLDEWSGNNKVHAVLVESSSARAFSAGMDVKGVAAAVQEDLHTPLVPKVGMSNQLGLPQDMLSAFLAA